LRVTPWLGLGVLAAGACGTGEGTSYILLDAPARAALIEVEAGGRHHTGALPLEVEGGQVELIGPSGRRRVALAANSLYQVDWSGQERGWALGSEVRTDVVEVAGPETAVRNLASALGAGPPQPWNGRWRLEGQDALVRLAWMGDVPEISEVDVVLTDATRSRLRSEVMDTPAEVKRGGGARPGTADQWLAALVGSYTSDAVSPSDRHTLFLDAEGGYVLQPECAQSAIRGTYRRTAGGIQLDGTDLALTIQGEGRLVGPGLVFSAGDEP
jgi:hypothetical protein